MADTWTLKALRAWTESYLKQKGVASWQLDAQVLLAHALGCKRIELFTRSDEEAGEAERARFRELVKRRVEGWPVAYLVGTKEFYRLELEVTPAVLIPRPETEDLVTECLRRLPKDSAASVLDVGTGSGCIALSVAQQRPQAQVTATDLSPDALAVARRNAEKHGLAGRVTFLEGDLFAPLPAGAKYQFLLSNPPYVAAGELPGLAPEVRDREPHLALVAGSDGLAVIRRLVAGAGARLEAGGWLLLEIGIGQDEAVRGLLTQAGGFAVQPTTADGAGIPRVVIAKKE